MVNFFLWIIPRCFFLCVALLISATANAIEVIESINPETSLVGWKIIGDGVEIELNQLLPLQAQAFYDARGVPTEFSQAVATSCVVQTIVRNTGEGNDAEPIYVDLGSWLVKTGNFILPVKVKRDWIDEWTGSGISKAAQIAFRWSTFPTRQTFLAGDYNWGMTTLGAAPGTLIDVKVVWWKGGLQKFAWVNHFKCAADRDI